MKSSFRIPITVRNLRRSAAFTGSVALVCLLALGCQNERNQLITDRNSAVQQQIDHDKALAQARADLEKQSASTNTMPEPPPPTSPLDPLHADKVKEDEIGLPIYPNAELYRMPGDSNGGVLTGNGMNVVLLKTTDKQDAVVAFYEPRLTHSAASTTGGKNAVKPEQQERMESGHRIVKLTETLANRSMRIVKITQQPDMTVIELMNILPSTSATIPNPTPAPSVGGSAPATDTVPMPSIPNPPNDPLKPPLLPGR